jgi:glycosyltransferase involved in cell wall biosynthesis
MFVTPWYPDEERPNSGIFIRAQALALAKEHQVLVISTKVNYKKRAIFSYNVEETISDNLAEYRLEVMQSLPLYNQLNYLLAASHFAIGKAKTFKPDIIHASIGYPGAILGWMISRKLKTPFVFTEHTRPANNFRSLWHTLITRFGIGKASAVMVVSQKLALEIRQTFNISGEVVPNIVEVERFKDVNSSTENVWQLGFIGGMNTPVKGLDILLQAVSQIKTPFQLHICGAGALMNTYKKIAEELKIADCCIFYGFIDPSKMPTFFSRIQTLICSSRYETFNISLIEAMASGMPVISTRCGGPEDFVNESNGILCDAENPPQLKDAIVKVMEHLGEYDAESIRLSASRFQPAIVSKQIIAVYLKAIAVFSPTPREQAP